MPVVTRAMAKKMEEDKGLSEISVEKDVQFTEEKEKEVEPRTPKKEDGIIPVGYYSNKIEINDVWVAIFAHIIFNITGKYCVGLKNWLRSYYIKIFDSEHAIYLYFYDNVLFINSDDLKWLNTQIGGDFIQLLRENQMKFNTANLSFRVFDADSMAGGYRRKNRKTRKGRKRHSKKRSSRKGRKTRSQK